MPNDHFNATQYNAQAHCPFIALAAEIDRDPAVRRIRLLLLASAPPAKAPPPLYQRRRPPRPPAPPPLPRCHRSQAYRASKDTGGDDDAAR
jgi:hypothetical protein